MSKKRNSTKSKTPYFGLLNRPNKQGRSPYEPRHIYRYLWDNTDRHGIIQYTFKELAETALVDRHIFMHFVSDMIQLGFVKDHDGSIRMLFSPDEIDWNEDLYDKLDVLRKRHFHKYKEKI